MARSLAYQGYWSVDGGTGRHEGIASSSHNEALRATRRLLSGQGYRVVREESWVGHVVLRRPDGLRALVEVVRVLPW